MLSCHVYRFLDLPPPIQPFCGRLMVIEKASDCNSGVKMVISFESALCSSYRTLHRYVCAPCNSDLQALTSISLELGFVISTAQRRRAHVHR